MDIKQLRVDCDASGNSNITMWVDCEAGDVENLIAWLRFAERLAENWRKCHQPKSPALRQVK